MTPIVTISHGEDGITLLVNNQPVQTLPHDKEGQRAAILAGLAHLPLLETEQGVYLNEEAAILLVAAVRFPDGIQTEDQYDKAVRTTGRACAHAGFGEAEQLIPPEVPFTPRGQYRRK